MHPTSLQPPELRPSTEVNEDIAALRADLEAHPGHAETWNALGVLLHGAGMLADAEDAFRQALVLKAELSDAEANRRDLIERIAPQPANPTRAFAVMTVSPPGYVHLQAMRELAETIHFGLRALGYACRMVTSPDEPSRTHIVLGAHVLSQYNVPVPDDAIIYNTEQVGLAKHWMTPHYHDLLRKHTVWDYSEANVAALKRLGAARVRHVPVGYVPELARMPPSAPEDIDIVFAGVINDRRKRILDALEARGFSVEALFGVYGAERDAWYARARIVLNVHVFDNSPFESVRVSYLLANRRFVVSEITPGDVDEGVVQGGIVIASYDELVETCARYLQAPEERARIAQAGFDRARARPMAGILRQALVELATTLAASGRGGPAGTATFGASCCIDDDHT